MKDCIFKTYWMCWTLYINSESCEIMNFWILFESVWMFECHSKCLNGCELNESWTCWMIESLVRACTLTNKQFANKRGIRWREIPRLVHRHEGPCPLKRSWPKASFEDDKTSIMWQSVFQTFKYVWTYLGEWPFLAVSRASLAIPGHIKQYPTESCHG